MNVFFRIGACVALCSMMACGHHDEHGHEIGELTVTRPQIQDTTIFDIYVAQVRAIQHIELRALEEGYLQASLVDEGQMVNKGQLLFKVMPIIYQSEVQKAKAEAKYSELEYLNTKQLADSNIVSKNELALAKARNDRFQAELSLAEAHLQFTDIRAPFSGMIGRFNEVRNGSLMEEGELLTTLSDNSKMWVYFNVPEIDYLNFIQNHNIKSPDYAVKFKMANGQIFDQYGTIETIEADFNNETGNIAFRATFPNPQALLRHGQTGKVLLPRKLEKAMLIPQQATFEILDKKYVYVVQNDSLIAKQIEVAYELPHVFVISKGITATDTILVDGLRKVKAGDKIQTRFRPQAEIVRALNQLEAE